MRISVIYGSVITRLIILLVLLSFNIQAKLGHLLDIFANPGPSSFPLFPIMPAFRLAFRGRNPRTDMGATGRIGHRTTPRAVDHATDRHATRGRAQTASLNYEVRTNDPPTTGRGDCIVHICNAVDGLSYGEVFMTTSFCPRESYIVKRRSINSSCSICSSCFP